MVYLQVKPAAALAQLKRATGEHNPPLGQFVLPGTHSGNY